MKAFLKASCFAAFLLALLSSASCAPGIRLKAQGSTDSEITGIYTLILNGCNYSSDLETIAFLDKEGDPYTFEPYVPDFRYRIKRAVPAAEALAAAKTFVQCNPSFNRVQVQRIVAPGGDVLGYEIRPLYLPFTYGIDNLISTDYWIRGDRVLITIRVDSSAERTLQGGADWDRD